MRVMRSILLVLALTSNSLLAQNPTIQNLLDGVRLDSLTSFVEQLSGEKPVVINGTIDTIKSRQALQPGNEKAFQFMKAEFIRFGYQIDSFQFGTEGKNLFAIKTGSRYPNHWIMLGAHYDNSPSTAIAPGADDNASGAAAVLEAGRIFAQYDFTYTVVFALWDEEESNLRGSKAYVPTIGSKNETLVGYVNIDMLGWDGNNDSVVDVNVRQIANSSELFNKAEYCNTAYNIQLKLHVIRPGSGASDHASFWDGGYSAIAINEEYDDDFNPYWHTPSDSLKFFNLSYYQQCAKLAYATVAELASDTTRTVGFNEEIHGFRLQIYPNPFANHFTISSEQPINIDNVILYDSIGQIVYETQPDSPFNSILMPEALERGLYFLKVVSGGNWVLTRIVKQ